MKFKIINKQDDVPIDEAFWSRAFLYGARELEIEHFHADVACLFVPITMRDIKQKPFAAGSTVQAEQGAVFCIKATDLMPPPIKGQMVNTFFHEMVHVRQRPHQQAEKHHLEGREMEQQARVLIRALGNRSQ